MLVSELSTTTKTRPGEVIDDDQYPEPPAAGQRVRNEVDRPAQIATLRDC
jgi:hypothetical protein